MAADRWYYAVYRTNKVMHPTKIHCGHEHETAKDAHRCLEEQEVLQGHPFLKVFHVHVRPIKTGGEKFSYPPAGHTLAQEG